MKNYLYLLFLTITLGVNAQTAPSYYQNVNFSLEGENLKQELSSLITNTHYYTVDYNELWYILKQTDENPENSQEVLLIYGHNNANAEDDDDYSRDKDATCGGGNPCTDETWNREHVFPKGLDDSNSNNNGPTADPHMLRASDVEMNSMRGSRFFADGSGVAAYITSNGDFYPGDNWKGDVARIIMYMYVRYGNQWNPNYVGADANNYHSDMPDIFLEWNAEDPVSEYELNRNSIVYSVQGNRNPFIDNPYLATRIWGGPAADNTWPGTLNVIDYMESEIKVYPNPTTNIVNVTGVSDDAVINVYNTAGQLINSYKANTQINLPNVGVYILSISDNNKVSQYKVIRK